MPLANENIEREEAMLDEDDVPDRLFTKLRSDLSIKEKIKIKVARYDNDYFLGIELDAIDDAIEENIRPLQKVTKELLAGFMNKNEKAKDRKLSWALRHLDEDFARDFKDKFENDRFSNTLAAQNAASELFKQHSGLYSASQAVVSKAPNGGRVVKRKLDAVIVPDNNAVNPRARVINDLNGNLAGQKDSIREILAMKKEQLGTLINQDTDDMVCARAAFGKPNAEQISTVEERKVVCIMALFHRMINN
jgi:hypothetical protein